MSALLDELRAMGCDIDGAMEADHIDEFRHLNSDVEYVSCPQVNRQLTTQRILVMECIEGIPLDHREELHQQGVDMTALGTKLGENYVKQIIEDGYFHADPHPGNIWVRNSRIVWLDLGMMGRLSNKDRTAIRKAVMIW